MERPHHPSSARPSRPRLTEEEIDALNRRTFNEENNSRSTEVQQQEDEEVRLFLSMMRETREMEQEYFRKNSEEAEAEPTVDVIYALDDAAFRIKQNERSEMKESEEEGVDSVIVTDRVMRNITMGVDAKVSQEKEGEEEKEGEGEQEGKEHEEEQGEGEGEEQQEGEQEGEEKKEEQEQEQKGKQVEQEEQEQQGTTTTPNSQQAAKPTTQRHKEKKSKTKPSQRKNKNSAVAKEVAAMAKYKKKLAKEISRQTPTKPKKIEFKPNAAQSIYLSQKKGKGMAERRA